MPFRAKTFKPTTFKLMGGITEVFPTTEQLTKRSKLPFYCGVKLRIMVSPQMQLTKYQPKLVSRLEADWGGTLSSLRCSTGDFRTALHAGKVSLGHVWAELYSIALHKVTFELGFGEVEFSENFWPLQERQDSIDYRILIFFSKKLPEEFGGLEYLVTGYLNAVIEEQPFPIRQRLDDFIIYRSSEAVDIKIKEGFLKRILAQIRGG